MRNLTAGLLIGALVLLAIPALGIDYGVSVHVDNEGATVTFEDAPNGNHEPSVDVSAMTVLNALDTLEALGEVASGSRDHMETSLTSKGYDAEAVMFSNLTIDLDVETGNGTITVNGNPHNEPDWWSKGDQCMDDEGTLCAELCAGHPYPEECMRACMAGAWWQCIWFLIWI